MPRQFNGKILNGNVHLEVVLLDHLEAAFLEDKYQIKRSSVSAFAKIVREQRDAEAENLLK